jgi:hypothetical protein
MTNIQKFNTGFFWGLLGGILYELTLGVGVGFNVIFGGIVCGFFGILLY